MDDSRKDQFEEQPDETSEEPEMELRDEPEPTSEEPDLDEEPETEIKTSEASGTDQDTREGPDEVPEISSTKDEQTMAMLAHLLGIITGFLGPLIIWLVKKDESEFVDDQGKEALNFQLTLLIGYIICFGPLNLLFCIGSVLGMALWVAAIVFCIMGATTANKGKAYRYPFNIRMIK